MACKYLPGSINSKEWNDFPNFEMIFDPFNYIDCEVNNIGQRTCNAEKIIQDLNS